MRFHPLKIRRVARLLRFMILATGLAAASNGWSRSTPAGPRAIGSLAQEMSPTVSRCLIRREPALVDAWLRTLPGSSQEARLVRGAEGRFPACFDRWGHRQGGWMPKYDTPGMRAAFVRALLQARRSRLPAEPPSSPESPWYPELIGEDPAAIVAADLGACLARKHWREVMAIVGAVDPRVENSFAWGYQVTKAALDREAAMVTSELSKVIPSIPGCAPAGARLRINRLRLLRLLEEAAYQLTQDRSAASASKFDDPR